MAHITYVPNFPDWSECLCSIKNAIPEMEHKLSLASYAEATEQIAELQAFVNWLALSVVQASEKEKCREIVRDLKS